MTPAEARQKRKEYRNQLHAAIAEMQSILDHMEAVDEMFDDLIGRRRCDECGVYPCVCKRPLRTMEELRKPRPPAPADPFEGDTWRCSVCRKVSKGRKCAYGCRPEL